MAKSTKPIKEYIVDAARARANSQFKHRTCQFSALNKAGENEHGHKHCTLTTNKSCKKCCFYDPTINATFEAMADELDRAQRAKGVFDENARIAKAIVKELEDTKAEIEKLEKSVKTEYKRIHIAEYDMRRLWEDSVNSYGM